MSEGFPLPLDAPWRMAMGLMALKPADWIEGGSDLAAALGEKRRLYAERFDDVFQALPDTQDAGAEVWARLHGFLPARFPDVYEAQGAGLIVKPLGVRVHRDDFGHPLAAAGLLVAEDLAIMRPQGAAHILAAGSIAFPSRWRLRDKIGRPMSAVHDPVPGLNEKMAKAIEMFFARLDADRPVQRYNWSLVDSDALHQEPGQPADPAISSQNAGGRLYLRVERQTLSRLPQTGDILFTIRIHQRALGRVIANPTDAARLKAAWETMPQAMQDYKSMTPYTQAVMAFLKSIR